MWRTYVPDNSATYMPYNSMSLIKKVVQDKEAGEFKCQVCEYKTREEMTFKDHLELHESLLKCPLCKCSTKSGQEINVYITTKHKATSTVITTDNENPIKKDKTNSTIMKNLHGTQTDM